MHGIEGIRLLKGHYPDMLLLMLTVYEDDELHLRCSLRGGVRVPSEEDTSRAPDRIVAGGDGRRRAYVAGDRTQGHTAVSRSQAR
jgi:hypothetical protein